ncbi:MAG TPA: hypothetical protein VFT19_11220 [Solirubrobacterales bacterium]|nr:hypothetical protein [Solirubrobacterales bacterium]
MNSDPADAPYKIAYDEAVRALSQQQGVIESFRTRAGMLLSAAALTTSFLGAQALNGGGTNVATWLALASFVGLSLATLAILWPHRWEFTADPENVIESYIETTEPLSVAEIHRDLSLHMHGSYAENRKGQRQLAARFRLASALLTLEVVFWIVDLASKA